MKARFLFSLILIILVSGANAQYDTRYRIMFYNLENLFDTIDNPNTNDEEFLVNGDKQWNNFRYWRKVNKTFQVVAAAGDYEPPEIIAVCEVEDFLPLYHITNNTPLAKFNYSIIHKNSPDRRGIDVALLYRRDQIKLLNYQFHPLSFKWDTSMRTREILHAELLMQSDTLHLFVNHWPSRRGGMIKSEPKRLEASRLLRKLTDSIQMISPDASIVIVGDFNDEPENKSLSMFCEDGTFVNLSKDLKAKCTCGTYKYRSHWNMLDQAIVSRNLLRSEAKVKVDSFYILREKFLLEPDESYGGSKPYRTYLGPRYIGGFSDHLPIVLNIETSP